MDTPIIQLKTQLTKYDWFSGQVIQEGPKSLIVYVSRMDNAIPDIVPDCIDGMQVKVHYIQSLTANLNQYVGTKLSLETFRATLRGLKAEYDLDLLLDVLEDIKEKRSSQSSIDNPGVRDKLAKLYGDFGADVLFDELG
jgi:hypothetical protein